MISATLRCSVHSAMRQHQHMDLLAGHLQRSPSKQSWLLLAELETSASAPELVAATDHVKENAKGSNRLL